MASCNCPDDLHVTDSCDAAARIHWQAPLRQTCKISVLFVFVRVRACYTENAPLAWRRAVRRVHRGRQTGRRGDRQTGPDVTALGWGSVRVLGAERTCTQRQQRRKVPERRAEAWRPSHVSVPFHSNAILGHWFNCWHRCNETQLGSCLWSTTQRRGRSPLTTTGKPGFLPTA